MTWFSAEWYDFLYSDEFKVDHCALLNITMIYLHLTGISNRKIQMVSRVLKREKWLDSQQNDIFAPSWPLCSTQHKAMQQMFEKLTCTNSYQINDGTITIFTFLSDISIVYMS